MVMSTKGLTGTDHLLVGSVTERVGRFAPVRPLCRAAGGIQGEFNWSSQHLDDEVLRCRNGNGDGQTLPFGLRCGSSMVWRRHGSGASRSSNGSG